VESLAAFLSPVLVLLLGIWIKIDLLRKKQNYSCAERLVGRRIDLYDEMGYKINAIYAYIQRVGKWKDTSPKTIIEYKRYVDEKMHSYQPIWSEATFQAYIAYMDSAFSTHSGHGEDAKIKSSAKERKDCFSGEGWVEAWNNSFTGKHDALHKEKYNILMASFFADFNISS